MADIQNDMAACRLPPPCAIGSMFASAVPAHLTPSMPCHPMCKLWLRQDLTAASLCRDKRSMYLKPWQLRLLAQAHTRSPLTSEEPSMHPHCLDAWLAWLDLAAPALLLYPTAIDVAHHLLLLLVGVHRTSAKLRLDHHTLEHGRRKTACLSSATAAPTICSKHRTCARHICQHAKQAMHRTEPGW